MLRKFFARLVSLFLPKPDRRTSRRKTGDRGEAAAEAFFRDLGYRVLARNWRAGRDEIDLVLLTPDGAMPVFVEVKTRRENDARGGYFAVDGQKKRALRRAIAAYMKAAGVRRAAFRFDIAEVREAPGGSLRVIHHCAVPLFSK